MKKLYDIFYSPDFIDYRKVFGEDHPKTLDTLSGINMLRSILN